MCSGLFQPPGWLKHIAWSSQCLLSSSLAEESVALGVGALVHRGRTFCCRPFHLSAYFLQPCESGEGGLFPIVVAPWWPSNHLVIQLLVDEPWPLPIRRDLRSQAPAGNYPPHSPLGAIKTVLLMALTAAKLRLVCVIIRHLFLRWRSPLQVFHSETAGFPSSFILVKKRTVWTLSVCV